MAATRGALFRHLVREFEHEAARACGTRHAVAFGAGRMGLHALVEALGIRAGDEVVLPGFTCVVVANARAYRGVRPVFADIDPITFNLDPARAEAAITPKTCAIYMQHTFGVSCDAEALRDIASRRGLLLIEDAAHSLGASYRGRPHGSLGDASFASTDRTKVINTHLGGFVTTGDDALATRLASARDAAMRLGWLDSRRLVFSFLAEFALRHPAAFWIGRPALGALRRAGALFHWSDELMEKLPAGYPYPSRLTPAQAGIGLSQIHALADNLLHRRAVARWLEERIGWYGQSLPGPLEDQAWLRYSMLVRDRDAFVERFGARIALGIWFPSVLFGRDTDLEAAGYRPGSCPVAERTARHIVNFPTHRRLPLAFLEELWKEHGDWLSGELLQPSARG